MQEVDDYVFYELALKEKYEGFYTKLSRKVNGLAFFYKPKTFQVISNEDIELNFVIHGKKRHTLFQFILLKLINQHNFEKEEEDRLIEVERVRKELEENKRKFQK